MSSSTLLQLVEKTANWDKDERYMAANDLSNILSRDVKIDEHVEQKICAAILKLLDDSSNDVQSVAVKCLAVLVKKVGYTHVGEIGKKLSELVVSGQATLRDIYSIGLKTLINDMPDTMGPQIIPNLCLKLVNGVIYGESEDAKRECLDSLCELLKRFGHLVNNNKEILSAMLECLKSSKAPIRKRAINCLGALAVVSNESLLNDLVLVLLNRIKELNASSAGTSQESRTLIQTIGSISRTVGYRLGRYLEQIVPLFVTFCGDPNDEDGQNEASNDLRESCFPGLESIVLRCPKEVIPHLDTILSVALSFMKYDPNYSYGSDEEVDGYDDEDYGDEDYGGSEDDDGSWKVRKAAIKVVDAVITTHAARLTTWFTRLQDELLSRFKEREENVKIDIVKCFSHLLSAMSTLKSALLTDKIISQALSQLQDKSVKVKTEILIMLKILVSCQTGSMEGHLVKIFAVMQKFLQDKNQGIRLESLQFLRCLYTQQIVVTNAQESIHQMLPLVLHNVKDEWYKSVAEALRLVAVLVRSMRPSVVIVEEDDEDQGDNVAMDTTSAVEMSTFPFDQYLAGIFDVVMAKLAVNDMDLEIKECAVHAMGTIVAFMGDRLPADALNNVFVVFHRRLDNEATRLVTLKAIQMIAKSSLQLSLSAFLQSSAALLAFFCKQYSRALRTLTLNTLIALANSSCTAFEEPIFELIIKELGPLIGDNDLFVAHLANSLVVSLIKKNPTVAVPLIAAHAHSKLISLATSSLTQGMALESLIQALKALVATSHHAAFTFDEVFHKLYATAEQQTGEINKQTLSNVSKCIAGICSTLPTPTLRSTMQSFMQDIQATVGAETRQAQLVLALLCVGEIGQDVDLSDFQGLAELLLRCFHHSSEDVKHAAAYTLGHIAIGNMTSFLPIILSSLSSQHEVRILYLLLLSLKENILLLHLRHAGKSEDVEKMLAILSGLTSHEDDSIRNILSECLGALMTLSMSKVLPVMMDLYSRSEQNKFHLWIVASALKACLARPLKEAEEGELARVLPSLLTLLQSGDLDVKKASLLMVNTAIHHNPRIIAGYLHDTVYPVLTETLVIKLERVVDLGPFKHKIDDNLPLRKISLACLETILHTLPERFDANAVLHIAPQLLSDQDDVKLLFLQILTRICEVNGSAVAVHAENMVAGLEATLAKAAKEAADSASATSNKEMIKAVVRFVFHADKVDEVKQVGRRWGDFSAKLRKAESIAEIVRSVELESAEQL